MTESEIIALIWNQLGKVATIAVPLLSVLLWLFYKHTDSRFDALDKRIADLHQLVTNGLAEHGSIKNRLEKVENKLSP